MPPAATENGTAARSAAPAVAFRSMAVAFTMGSMYEKPPLLTPVNARLLPPVSLSVSRDQDSCRRRWG